MSKLSPTQSLACFAIALLFAAAPAFSADRGLEKRYPLPEHGFFKLSAPAAWKDEITQVPKPVPPTITFRPGEGNAFEIRVIPLWRPRPDIPIPTKEMLREEVGRGAENIKAEAVEKEIKTVEFQGKTGPGFYFSATDKDPSPGDFKFLTQGMLMVSELLVTFTILTNEVKDRDQVVRAAIAMLKTAAHEQP